MWQKMSLENTLIVAGDFDVRDFCNNVNEDDDDEDQEGSQYKQLIAVKGGVRQNVPLQPFERLEQLSSRAAKKI